MDRISYSRGEKVNMGNYESSSVDCSMSTDIKDNETPEDALKRCRIFVESVIKRKIEKLRLHA